MTVIGHWTWFKILHSLISYINLSPPRQNGRHFGCWPSSLAHICGTRGRWVNLFLRCVNADTVEYGFDIATKCRFSEYIFKCIYLERNVWIWIEIPPMFIAMCPVNMKSALDEIMAWYHAGGIHLSGAITTLYSISQEICTRLLLCCALLWFYIDRFSHIHQAYFTSTVAI